MSWLQAVLEAIVVKFLCVRQGVQNCHRCHDFDCCDNLQGGLRAWQQAIGKTVHRD
jgi:hypothetical protein